MVWQITQHIMQVHITTPLKLINTMKGPTGWKNRQAYRDRICPADASESVRKQIGMAVPCQGAKIIFEAILKTFAGIPYESMEPNLQD